MIEEQIPKAIKKATKVKKVHLETPEIISHGDWATNVAMVLAKKEKKNPRELAEQIKKDLLKDSSLKQIVSKIEVAGPGFINFWIKEEYLVKELEKVLSEKEKYGQSGYLKGEKVVCEFTDPNPFKEFHIGHVYTNTVGEAISRILEATGATVKRANYQGDVGMHVAKAVWGLQKKMHQDGIGLDSLSKKALKTRIKYLGDSYAKGALAYTDSESSKEEIEELNKKVYKLDPSVKELYQKGRAWSLDYFETLYKRLGTKFDYYYFEREAGEVGLKIVENGLKAKVFEEGEGGAIVFKGEKHGLHTRVFVNAQGLPTYEAKDLGLAITKFKEFKYDRSIIMTGNEIVDYFKVVLAALSELEPELARKTTHMGHGMVRLTSGKMSSRTGEIIVGEELLDEVKEKVLKLMKDSKAKDKDEIADQITVAAVKYSFLRVGFGKDIIFDVEKSLSTEGESGPYLQYSYARTKSVQKKAKKGKVNLSVSTPVKTNNEEQILMRSIVQFQGVIIDAAKNYSPNLLCNYLFDLAQKFNTFYNAHKIIGSASESLRLVLTAATGQVLTNGLEILGISTPNEM